MYPEGCDSSGHTYFLSTLHTVGSKVLVLAKDEDASINWHLKGRKYCVYM
jgi:hypothetical protein